MPAHRPGQRDPGPDLSGAVPGLHELVVGHVEQLAAVRLAELLEEPALEVLVDVADARLADEVAQPAPADNATRSRPS